MMGQTTLTFDSVIVGAGPAGWAAARRLRQSGKKIAVVDRAPSALSLSSGCWDFGPIPRGGRGFDELFESELWRERYARILADWREPPTSESLRREADALARALERWLPLASDFDSPFCLPSMSGALKWAFIAQSVQASADLSKAKKKKIGFLTGTGWRLRADLLIAQWRQAAQDQELELDVEIIDWDWGQAGHDWPLPHVAIRLRDDTALRGKLIDFLLRKTSELDLLLFPPLLLSASSIEELKETLKIPFGECVSHREPTAGFRLEQAGAEWLDSEQVSRLRASRVQPHIEGNLLRHLSCFTEDGWFQLHASHFILATGRYLGGGLALEPHGAREAILNLPLFSSDGKRLTPGPAGHFRCEREWATAGLRVDHRFRPLDETGRPALNNVMACGSLLGGIDFARESIGIGFFAYTGGEGAGYLV